MSSLNLLVKRKLTQGREKGLVFYQDYENIDDPNRKFHREKFLLRKFLTDNLESHCLFRSKVSGWLLVKYSVAGLLENAFSWSEKLKCK